MSIITFFTLAVLSPTLAKNYNVQGVIAASVIAHAGGTLYGLHTARKNHGISIETRTLMKIYLSSAASVVPALMTLQLTGTSNLFKVAAGALLYIFVYATLTPLTGAVTAPEVETAAVVTQKVKLMSPMIKPLLKYQQKILNALKQPKIQKGVDAEINKKISWENTR